MKMAEMIFGINIFDHRHLLIGQDVVMEYGIRDVLFKVLLARLKFGGLLAIVNKFSQPKCTMHIKINPTITGPLLINSIFNNTFGKVSSKFLAFRVKIQRGPLLLLLKISPILNLSTTE